MIEERTHYKLDKNLTMDSVKRPIPKARTLTPVKKPTLIKKSSPVSKPYKDMKIPFGKHVGKLIADIPNGYLEWLLNQEFFETKFREYWEMTKKEIEYREKFDIHINE